MDETVPRGYPFPQCEPPLTQDAADIKQLRDLALAVESDVAGLDTLSGDLIVTPDGCLMAQTAPVAYNSGDFIDFNVIGFDNTPGNVMGDTVNDGVHIRQSGQYLVTCWFSVSTGASSPRAAINVVGLGDVLYSEVGSGAGSGSNVAVSTSLILLSGTLIKLRISHSVAGTATVDMARLATVRLI
jgi:hypothetical protein